MPHAYLQGPHVFMFDLRLSNFVVAIKTSNPHYRSSDSPVRFALSCPDRYIMFLGPEYISQQNVHPVGTL